MKKLALLMVLALAASAHAQGAPGTISFVARLADNGAPITGSHDLVLELFDAQTGGTSVWSETRTNVTIPSDGLLYLDLGSVTPLDANVFSGSKRYLEVTIDNQITTPRITIESAPYAIRSGEASHAADSDSLGTHPASFYQARVSNACMSGSAIASIDATGGVMCQPVPTYTAATGGGLLLTGGAFSVDPTKVQSRVTGVCNSGAIERVLQDGTVTCLTAGLGLAFSTDQFLVDFATTQHAIAPCAAGAVLSKTDSNGGASCISAGTGLSATAASWAVDTTAIQKRVTDTCSTGAITAIAADGSVTCGGTGAVVGTSGSNLPVMGTSYASNTSGPTVTTTIGPSGSALVTLTAQITPTLGNSAIMGFSIDTAAPNDFQVLEATSTLTQASATYLVTSLTPGSHSFTAKYKISGGTQAQFQYRSVIVIPQ
jgi:hypothetical protein